MRGSRQQPWCRLRVAPTGSELLVTELRGRATLVQFRLIVLGFNDMSLGVVGWCKGAVYLSSPGRPTDIGLQLGKACYPCSG